MISILMTTHNGEKFLREQLDSILNQDYFKMPGNDSFRIIISDDCSEDGTLAILDEYASKYSNIEVIRRTSPSGSAPDNFFSLISKMQTEAVERGRSADDYYALSDQDDIWLQGKIRKSMLLMNLAEKTQVDGKEVTVPVLIHTDLKLTDKDGNVIGESMAAANHMRVDRKNLNYMFVENAVSGNTILFNGEFLKNFVIPKECIMHDWWMALVAKVIGRIEYIDEPTVLYRQHSDNVYGSSKHFTAEEIKENYRKMYVQAEELFTHYGSIMNSEEQALTRNFIVMKNAPRFVKIGSIIKNKFYKSQAIMTLGEMLKI